MSDSRHQNLRLPTSKGISFLLDHTLFLFYTMNLALLTAYRPWFNRMGRAPNQQSL